MSHEYDVDTPYVYTYPNSLPSPPQTQKQQALYAQQQPQHKQNTPRYAEPTTSTNLPQYTNAEADVIKQSFSTGNYRMLQHLPCDLRPHHITSATAARLDENSLLPIAQSGTYRKLTKSDALFSTFEYIPSPYALASQLINPHASTTTIDGQKPFLSATPRPLLINGLAGKASYDTERLYNEPYKSQHDLEREERMRQEAATLHGPFVPSTRGKSIGEDCIIRKKLPDIIKSLMETIRDDYSDVTFQIYSDEQDFIILQFQIATIDNLEGLIAYMNMFIKTNRIISHYSLCKLVELWNVLNDDSLYFALRPPWVKRRVDETYFLLHPEMKTLKGTQQLQLQQQQKMEEEKKLIRDREENHTNNDDQGRLVDSY